MKNEFKEIIPGVGLGAIKFGYSREQIKKLLGEPDDIESYSYTDSEEDMTESWHYDELELSLSFDEAEDWKLVTISVSSEFYLYKGFSPVGMSKQNFLSEIKKQNLSDLEYEDFATEESENQELYFTELQGINFWLDDAVVTEVQWGPLFLDDTTVNWPAQLN
jgi:hypothetical protein